MKTAVLAFKGCLDQRFDEMVRETMNIFGSYSFEIDNVTFIKYGDREEYLNVFKNLLDTYDNIIVIQNENNNYDPQEALEEKLVNEVCIKDGKSVFIHDGTKRGLQAVEEKFIPHLKEKTGRYFGKITFKLFGVDLEKLNESMKKIKSEHNIEYLINGSAQDYRVDIIYDQKTTVMDYDGARRDFVTEYYENIYADSDVSLQQRLVELLKLRNLKISTSESFTGGNVASRIVAVPGASNVFYEGVVSYNEDAKEKRLGVKHETLAHFKPVSSQVAFEMSMGLLKTGKCDVAISTTGIAGPTSDDSGFPVGLCYIGIGYDREVNVFKYLFNGTRDEIISLGTNTALYKTIMLIKEI